MPGNLESIQKVIADKIPVHITVIPVDGSIIKSDVKWVNTFTSCKQR